MGPICGGWWRGMLGISDSLFTICQWRLGVQEKTKVGCSRKIVLAGRRSRRQKLPGPDANGGQRLQSFANIVSFLLRGDTLWSARNTTDRVPNQPATKMYKLRLSEITHTALIFWTCYCHYLTHCPKVGLGSFGESSGTVEPVKG